MVMKKDEKQLVKLIQRIFIKLAFDLVFFNKAKRDNNEIVQINS